MDVAAVLKCQLLCKEFVRFITANHWLHNVIIQSNRLSVSLLWKCLSNLTPWRSILCPSRPLFLEASVSPWNQEHTRYFISDYKFYWPTYFGPSSLIASSGPAIAIWQGPNLSSPTTRQMSRPWTNSQHQVKFINFKGRGSPCLTYRIRDLVQKSVDVVCIRVAPAGGWNLELRSRSRLNPQKYLIAPALANENTDWCIDQAPLWKGVAIT